MHKIEFESCGRSMRWHEWLAGLFLLGLISGVRAESVYKCVDARGAIAYQAQTCDASQQRQSVINISPAPPLAPAPHYVLARQEEQAARPLHAARERAPREMAYECRVSDGRIFYRLGTCPHSLAADAGAGAKAKRGKSGGARGAGAAAHVASRQIPREQACREIHRAGAIGRDGHEFDERVSTYERNLGHDPCK